MSKLARFKQAQNLSDLTKLLGFTPTAELRLKVGDGPKGGISWRRSHAAILCREKDMPHDEDDHHAVAC